MTDDIHSCSYYCDRPACIKAQRDELRESVEKLQGRFDGLQTQFDRLRDAYTDDLLSIIIVRDKAKEGRLTLEQIAQELDAILGNDLDHGMCDLDGERVGAIERDVQGVGNGGIDSG